MASKHDIIEDFKGYQEKVDVTKMDPGYFIKGSQNVLIKDSRTVGIRRGYELVGQENKVDLLPIRASYDFANFKGDERNLRTWGDRIEVLLDGEYKLLKDGFSSDDFYFSKQDFWDHEAKLGYAVFVNNENTIMKWNGAVAKFDSATTDTITKVGAETWAETGFEKFGRTEMQFKIRNLEGVGGKTLSVTLKEIATGVTTTHQITTTKLGDTVLTAEDMASKWNASLPDSKANSTHAGNKVYVFCKKEYLITAYTTTDTEYDYILPDPIVIRTPKIEIGGTSYSYTGGHGTNVLTGVTPDPTLGGHTANDNIFQSIEVINNTDVLDLPDENKNTAIEVFDNQLYIASSENRFVYVSEISRCDSFYFGRPKRLVGEGARFTLGGNFNAMSPREGAMYIQFGFGSWVTTQIIDSSDLSSQSLVIRLLDVNAGDGVINKRGIAPMKNKTMFISKDKAFNFIGRVENLETPQTKNISDRVKDLFSRLNFDDMDMIYHKHYIYIAVPKESMVLMYNLERQLWEAPQIMPISCFSVINGELHGHSYNTPETYKLFTGLSDNGVPIESICKFSYINSGSRTQLKKFNEMFVEGYIEEKTNLKANILLDIDGSSGERNFEIRGDNSRIMKKRNIQDSSLGKSTLGKRGLGTTDIREDKLNKFIGFKGINPEDHYEYSFEVQTNQEGADWELIAFAPATDVSEKQSTINKF